MGLQQLQQDGKYTVDDATLKAIQETFCAGYLMIQIPWIALNLYMQKINTLLILIQQLLGKLHKIIQQKTNETIPMVILSTASPYKSMIVF